jgi:superoxide dismutase, Cu-Zn family
MRLALVGLTALALVIPAAALVGVVKKDQALVIPLKTSKGEDAGTATFTETKKGKLSIKLALKNMPEGDHAVHIHQKPVCDAPDFTTAGGHFNPDGKQHGTLNPMGHHNGDLGQNLSVGVEHTVNTTILVDYLSLGTGKPNDITANGGTSIVIHAKGDDMKTDPTGNAGNRIACGIIMSNP